MTTLEQKIAANSQALIPFDKEWSINRANKAAAYLFVPLTKEELGTGLYNVLKCRDLLTLNELRKLDLNDFAAFNNCGIRKLEQLKQIVESKNGWFYADHQSPELIQERMTKQQNQQAEQKTILSRPNSQEEKNYQEQLKEVSVLNLFSEHSKLYKFFPVYPENKNSHTALKNQLISAQISDKSFSLYDLSLYATTELKDLGIGKKSAVRFIEIIHKVGGRFKDDPVNPEQYSKLASFHLDYNYITGVDAVKVTPPKKKDYIDNILHTFGENHKDLILTKIEDAFPHVQEETLQKLYQHPKGSFIGDLILNGIPDNAGLDSSEIDLLQKNAEDMGIELNMLKRLEMEYDSEYPEGPTLKGTRINRLVRRFNLKPGK